MVLLIYIYLAVHLPMPNCKGYDYERLRLDEESDKQSEEESDREDPRNSGLLLDVDKRDPALVLAAVLYWVVMPVALVTLGFGATCAGGAPNVAFIVYGGCFAIHFACIFWAMTGSLKEKVHDTPMLLSCFFLAALEHFDMASDALFTGTSAACSDEITDLWLKSWNDVPGCGFLVPVLSKLGFSGVALTMFVTNAYLPQLLVVLAFVAPFVALVFVTLVILWAALGCWVGLPAMLAVFALLIRSGFGHWQMGELQRGALCEDSLLALYVGAEIVKLPDCPGLGGAEGRALFILGTKLVLENLLQLWLQSSYLSLSYDRMDTSARWQAMASIAVGVCVAGGKGLKIAAVAVPAGIRNAEDIVRQRQIYWLLVGAIGVFMMLAGFGCLAWVVAKVVFIFRCDSHVWNLSTGCVSPEM
ncbi:unnamed protein product [Symbiodinium sp. CCMP2592]|nr:unnamed protein product [Symbiodinium sp. CCMP2592]